MLVLRQGIRPVLVGLLVGVAAALAVGRLIGGFLFGTEARDPAAISAVVVILLLVAALAMLGTRAAGLSDRSDDCLT
jgi:putative ABC transport system permease protein